MGDPLPPDLLEWAPEVVVHLAWEGIPDLSAEMCDKNLRDQISFFERVCALASVRKIVVTGSCREYGDARGPCAESSPVGQLGSFGSAKDAIRRGLESICVGSCTEAAWLRVFFAYGPGQRFGSLIPSWVDSFARGEEVPLKSPDTIHDFVHVEDVAIAVKCAVENPEATGVFNVGSGTPTTVSVLAETVKTVWLGENPLGDVTIPSVDSGSQSGMWADLARINEVMVWFPQIDLLSGVGATVRILKNGSR